MQSQRLEATPDQVNNLMGDDARAQFIKRFIDEGADARELNCA